jgi:hypothetical protein
MDDPHFSNIIKSGKKKREKKLVLAFAVKCRNFLGEKKLQ